MYIVNVMVLYTMCILHQSFTGFLASPTNLFIDHTSDTTIHLTWTPPHTLDVNNTKQEIYYYEVIISDNANGTFSLETTNLSEYTYYKRDYLQCKRLIFQIAAVNEIGRGNLSEMITASFSGRK